MDLDSLRESNWDFIDINGFLNDVPVDPFLGNHYFPQSVCRETDGSLCVGETVTCASVQGKGCAETDCPRKRGRGDPCSGLGTKACRERHRRDKLNQSFSELSSILEPKRAARTDKLAILRDAIRVLNELKSESLEYKEMNEKLLMEIKTLKKDKNELREEKMRLKADKDRIERQLKAMNAVPTSLMPPAAAAYHVEASKMAIFPGYGFVPMWQYLPPPVRDTSRDHELRSPAA